MPYMSCGQSVSAPRGKAGTRLNVHTELRAKRQRSVREAMYRNRPITGPYLDDVGITRREEKHGPLGNTWSLGLDEASFNVKQIRV
jgi:hypothetical protein